MTDGGVGFLLAEPSSSPHPPPPSPKELFTRRREVSEEWETGVLGEMDGSHMMFPFWKVSALRNDDRKSITLD